MSSNKSQAAHSPLLLWMLGRGRRTLTRRARAGWTARSKGDTVIMCVQSSECICTCTCTILLLLLPHAVSPSPGPCNRVCVRLCAPVMHVSPCMSVCRSETRAGRV